MTGHEQTDRAPQEPSSTDRVILLTVSTEFEAHTIVAVLDRTYRVLIRNRSKKVEYEYEYEYE